MGRLFEDRERAEELLFARSEEARFLAHCNALRKLAAYAGERRGLDMQATETYAETLISLSVEGHRDAELPGSLGTGPEDPADLARAVEAVVLALAEGRT